MSIDDLSHLADKRILILGYGREGKSSHRFLSQHFPSAEIALADANAEQLPPSVSPESVRFGPGYLDGLCEFDVIVRSPGIPLRLPKLQAAAAAGVEITSQTEFFMRIAGPERIIGVTGTKGKSTTSALIHALLSRQLADVRLVGNIGKPALDHLAGLTGETLFVAELSSFQLEGVHLSPATAVLLEVVPEHLDHHGSYEEYLSAKQNILRYQPSGSRRVMSDQSPAWSGVLSAAASTTVSYCLTQPPAGRPAAYFDESSRAFFVLAGGSYRRLVDLEQIKLRGRGNIANVLAAISAASSVVELDLPHAAAALEKFEPLPHRLEYAGEFSGIRFYNDSLSTIPQAAINAIDALGAEVETVMLGGFDRGLDYSALAQALFAHRSHIKNIVLFPGTGEKIRHELRQLAKSKGEAAEALFNICHAQSMQAAVEFAMRHTSAARACLLSPGSSSFGLFRDYHDRGTQFKEWIARTARQAANG